MNARYDAEYEQTYDAANKRDRLEYAFLWGQKTKKAPRKPAQKEEIWWYSKEGIFCFSSGTPKLISKRLLQAARTKTANRTQGHGAGRRKQKDEGNPKGSRPLALQRLREANKSNGYKGLRDYRDHKDY